MALKNTLSSKTYLGSSLFLLTIGIALALSLISPFGSVATIAGIAGTLMAIGMVMLLSRFIAQPKKESREPCTQTYNPYFFDESKAGHEPEVSDILARANMAHEVMDQSNKMLSKALDELTTHSPLPKNTANNLAFQNRLTP